MSESGRVEANDHPRSRTQCPGGAVNVSFWPFVWLGIALAGAVFGLMVGLMGVASEGLAALFGFVVGLLFAGIVAAPMVLIAATASWALAARRVRTPLAVMAGTLTAILCTLPAAVDSGGLGLPSAAIGAAIVAFAGLLGALGGGIAALLCAGRPGRISEAAGDGPGEAEHPAVNRFLRMGVLVAVVAIVLGGCLELACAVRQARAAGRRNECTYRLEQIALCLKSHEAEHGALPPAYITDKTGQPVLSWRVAVARYCFYDIDFSGRMDLGQPWNSPKNARFLDSQACFLSYPFHCPSSGQKRNNPITDYVAVVGPDTLWPGKVPGDLKKHPNGILVVEWPESDIHWAEPRDVTVEEFLDWFRTSPPRRGLWDWFRGEPPDHETFHPGGLLYVDAAGNVGELPRDTDPETVRKLLVGP